MLCNVVLVSAALESESAICIYICCYLVTKLCPTVCDPMNCSPPEYSSMRFSRQEYWSGLLSRGFFTAEPLGKPHMYFVLFCF